MPAFLSRLGQAIYGNPYIVLCIATLCWSGNAIAGRLAVGEVSPMTLTFLRWVGVALVLLVFARRTIKAEWPALRANLGYVIGMGTVGFTTFNALFYLASHFTTAVNMGILQGSIPILVFALALAWHGTRVTPTQILAVIIGLSGVAIVAIKGDLATIRHLTFNSGDLLILAACLAYASYTALLQNRPRMSGLAFFAGLSGAALVSSLVPFAVEAGLGQVVWPTPAGWLVVAYVALFPSVVSQLMFIRGVELIGPGRAGIFVNLIPVFASILAILILGEPFHPYHALALALVLGGIFFAERSKP
ncbi:putative DMT superfamily transporter inner membrane protein [Hartmannibacter diazotrophicus]|uniref:Putative DMT superfamily transporter inner membrane protein n=1 Tax=Hartmannibacter diazotrophicus TaxID=1482074 RepID=A0A2C9DA14_9HYPH|nr:DMT family transporter [Hartmannibacter diazotrophicus]SON57127.1 putative DMT superfamily transporter inner membrane protein [Hartmannibacter diazotrophicus]